MTQEIPTLIHYIGPKTGRDFYYIFGQTPGSSQAWFRGYPNPSSLSQAWRTAKGEESPLIKCRLDGDEKIRKIAVNVESLRKMARRLNFPLTQKMDSRGIAAYLLVLIKNLPQISNTSTTQKPRYRSIYNRDRFLASLKTSATPTDWVKNGDPSAPLQIERVPGSLPSGWSHDECGFNGTDTKRAEVLQYTKSQLEREDIRERLCLHALHWAGDLIIRVSRDKLPKILKQNKEIFWGEDQAAKLEICKSPDFIRTYLIEYFEKENLGIEILGGEGLFHIICEMLDTNIVVWQFQSPEIASEVAKVHSVYGSMDPTKSCIHLVNHNGHFNKFQASDELLIEEMVPGYEAPCTYFTVARNTL